MNDKLIVQRRVSADRGEERVTMLECSVTGDIILRFGASYTLRAKAGEMAALLPPSMAAQRVRRRSAYAVEETQLGTLSYDDLLWLRRKSAEVSQQLVT